MNNFNIAWTADPSAAVREWRAGLEPDRRAGEHRVRPAVDGELQRLPDATSGATRSSRSSGPTHAAGPNYAKSIQEWVLNPDGTRRVSAAGEPPNPRESWCRTRARGTRRSRGWRAGRTGFTSRRCTRTRRQPVGVGRADPARGLHGDDGADDWYKFDEASGTAATDSGEHAERGDADQRARARGRHGRRGGAAVRRRERLRRDGERSVAASSAARRR